MRNLSFLALQSRRIWRSIFPVNNLGESLLKCYKMLPQADKALASLWCFSELISNRLNRSKHAIEIKNKIKTYRSNYKAQVHVLVQHSIQVEQCLKTHHHKVINIILYRLNGSSQLPNAIQHLQKYYADQACIYLGSSISMLDKSNNLKLNLVSHTWQFQVENKDYSVFNWQLALLLLCLDS